MYIALSLTSGFCILETMIKKWLYKWLFSNFDLLEIELFFNIYFEIIFDVQKSCKNSIVHIYPYSFYPNVNNIHT